MLFNKSNTDNPNYPFLLSYKDKKANDFEFAKAMMDYYNTSSHVIPNRMNRFNENFNLHRGAWPEIENMAPTTTINIYNENVNLGGGKLYHFPIINTVSQTIVGDIIANPIIPIIRDTSTKARNHRDRVRADRVREFFQNKYIKPRLEQLQAQFQGQEANLPPDFQQQLEQEVMKSLPEEIVENLDDYKMPDELLIEIIYKHVLEAEQVKEKLDSGADFAVVVAEEYSMVYIDRTGPKLKPLNAKYVDWGASPDVETCEDGEWAKYTEYLTFQDLIARFGTEIKLSTLKEILDLYSPIPGTDTHTRTDAIDFPLVDTLAANPGFQDPSSELYIDVKTREGQEKLKGLYRTLSGLHNSNSGIKVTYITWRWTRNGKVVESIDGKERIVDEHYVKNPARGDKTIRKVLLPQVWHGYIINDMYYVGIEPVPWQYENLMNPFKPKLTIHGLKYNTFMGNTSNSSFVDLGKPFNFRINLLLKKLQEYESTDIGKVLFLTSDIKPDKQTWGQWYSSLFQSRVALLNKKFEGSSVQERSPIIIQDLSRTSEIGSTIEKLNWFEGKLIRAMHYNPSKFGDISQYATNDNTQLSLMGVDRQMLRFLNKRRAYKRSVLTSLLNASIAAFQDNEYMKELLFDDYLKVHYEQNVEPFSMSSLALFLVDDFEESKKLEGMRSLALSIIQNGGSARDIARVFSASSMAEIESVLAKSDKKKEEAISAQRQHESEQMAKQQEIAQLQVKLKQEFDALENERDRQVKLEMAKYNSMLMANAQDIDQNNMSDTLQKTLLEISSKEKMHEKEMALERLKLSKV